MAGKRSPLVVIFLVVFIDLLGFGIVLPLLPRYAEDWGASKAVIGLLMASFSFMQFLFAPIWGRVSDRIGRRPILLLGLFGSFFFYGLFAYASVQESLFLVFVSRIGAGIAGATISTAQAFIADSTAPEKRASGMALIGAAFGIGFTFGPMIGGVAFRCADLAGPTWGPALPGLAASLLSLAALLLAIVVLPESLDPANVRPRAGVFQASSWKMLAQNRVLGRLVLVFFLATLAFAMFESTISLLSKKAFGFDEGQNFWLFTYLGFSLMIAQGFIVRRLAKKFAENRLSLIGVAIMAGSLLLARWSAIRSGTGEFLAIIPMLIVGYSLLTTSSQGLLSRLSPADQQGSILGVNQAASAMSRILGPVLGMLLFNDQSAEGLVRPYLASAIFMAIAFFLLLRVRIEKTSG